MYSQKRPSDVLILAYLRYASTDCATQGMSPITMLRDVILCKSGLPCKRDLVLGKRDLLLGKRDLLLGKRDLHMGLRGNVPYHNAATQALPYGKSDLPYGTQALPYGKRDLPYGKRDLQKRPTVQQHLHQPSREVGVHRGLVACVKSGLPYGKRDLLHGKRALPYGKRDLAYGKRDLPYGKRDLPVSIAA